MFGLIAGAVATETRSPEAAATLVLYNSAIPSSKALAEYYAKKRAIPPDQVLGLPCSLEEEISRDEFLVTLLAPLRLAFNKFGWWQTGTDPTGRRFVQTSTIRFVAVIRGIPMKIRPEAKVLPSDLSGTIPPGSPLAGLISHNEASVDSELAALFSLREELPAFVPNPYFRRFTPILQLPAGDNPLLVCRLDGPNNLVVRRMIDDSLQAERTGLWGWAYVDTRSITSPAYISGDRWLLDTADTDASPGHSRDHRLRGGNNSRGLSHDRCRDLLRMVCGECHRPLHPAEFPFPARTQLPFTSIPSAPQPCASPKAAWAAPLLDRGADATMGNVYEPFLELTVHFDILQDRLMSGMTLAESAYAAYRGLSWMGVIVGDPLYRPYAKWTSLAEDDTAPSLWQQYRTTVLGAGGDPVAASDSLHKLARRSGQSMPLEALGQSLAAAGRTDEALTTLSEAAAMKNPPAYRFRIALEQIDILRHAGRKKEALARIAEALGDFPGEQAQITLGRLTLIMSPPPPSPSPTP